MIEVWNLVFDTSLGCCYSLLVLFPVVQIFRPLLNIKVKLSAEEFETALIAPKKHFGRDTHTSTEGWALSFEAIDR